MIPPILHQTWKTARTPPRFDGYIESWKRHNPGWRYHLWTDRDLLEFVSQHYPDYLDAYCRYPNGVMRADLGRYMLLHHFGGVYADIDCECLAPFDPIMDEKRAVFCREPIAHTLDIAPRRCLPYLLFNGTMASPARHPFWLHLLNATRSVATSLSVLDSTGPTIMTSAALNFADPGALITYPPRLFCGTDKSGAHDEEGGDTVPRLSVHHWAGSWMAPPITITPLKRLRGWLYRARYELTKGAVLNVRKARAAVDPACLAAGPPEGANLAILVPLRDAAENIDPFLRLIGTLDYPRGKIKLVFCEGDSADGSWEKLRSATAALTGYRDIVLLRHHTGTPVDRNVRYLARKQRARRSAIAKVRNALIDGGIDSTDDWALWIDIDVWRFPSGIVNSLLNAGRRIVVPNCVRVRGEDSFDMNSFSQGSEKRDRQYWRRFRDGLYQPERGGAGRFYLSDLRHLDAVELEGVGGTMLLVDAALHRGGLRFPELPYRGLIETEGLGALAADLGVTPIGLPKLEILHVPW